MPRPPSWTSSTISSMGGRSRKHGGHRPSQDRPRHDDDGGSDRANIADQDQAGHEEGTGVCGVLGRPREKRRTRIQRRARSAGGPRNPPMMPRRTAEAAAPKISSISWMGLSRMYVSRKTNAAPAATPTKACSELRYRRHRNSGANITPPVMSSPRCSLGDAACSMGKIPKRNTMAATRNQNMAPMLSGRGGGHNAAGACRRGGTLSGRSLDAAMRSARWPGRGCSNRSSAAGSSRRTAFTAGSRTASR